MVENFSFLNVQKLLHSDGDASLGLDDYQQFTKATDKNERSGIEGYGATIVLTE